MNGRVVVSEAEREAAKCASRGPYVNENVAVSPASWWELAACRSLDADLFHVPDGVPLRRKRECERQAKRICWTCPVREYCLAEALDRDEQHGVWGGLDAEERRQLKRRTEHEGSSGGAARVREVSGNGTER